MHEARAGHTFRSLCQGRGFHFGPCARGVGFKPQFKVKWPKTGPKLGGIFHFLSHESYDVQSEDKWQAGDWWVSPRHGWTHGVSITAERGQVGSINATPLQFSMSYQYPRILI